MTLEIKLITMILGAIVGGFTAFLFNLAKEKIAKKREDERDLNYLTIRVSCELEKFANHSFSVATDHGITDQTGAMTPLIQPPTFDPFQIDVNWKVLPIQLMYKILELPNDLHFANELIKSVVEHVSSAPEHSEYFAERKYFYSKLAWDAFSYVDELRKLGEIPVKEYGEWDAPIRLIEIHMQACRDTNRKVIDLEIHEQGI